MRLPSKRKVAIALALAAFQLGARAGLRGGQPVVLTAREAAANRYASIGGMPVKVIGFSRFDYEQLRAARLDAMRRAVAALRAAQGSARFLVGEWDDDRLEEAAWAVEDLLAAESVAPLPGGPTGLTHPAGFD